MARTDNVNHVQVVQLDQSIEMDVDEIQPWRRALLLTAIARARSWMNDLGRGRVASFEEVARRENKVERHIRRLISTCFRVATYRRSHYHGSAPADVTVTSLTGALPHSWTEQEQKFGVV